jgi:hypothetical protein
MIAGIYCLAGICLTEAALAAALWVAVPGLLGLCLVRGSARRLSLLAVAALPFLAGPALQTMRDWRRSAAVTKRRFWISILWRD